MKPTLLVLAAGMGSRYGGLKQMDGVGPSGETIIDYSIYDAVKAGFGKVVYVVREYFLEQIRELVKQKYGSVKCIDGKPLEFVFVTQELDKIPAGYKVDAERVKPWGTAHAVMMASKVINEPFAIINGDDYYGRDSFAIMADWCRAHEGKAGEYALMGFKIANTLSESGGVSRGVCSCGENGYLTHIEEHLGIERCSDSIIRGKNAAGEEVIIKDDTPVSMNMFGFTPDFFSYCDDLFKDFLKEHSAELKSEFYIPYAVDCVIKSGKGKMELLSTPDSWFGVTYKEDRPAVVAKFASLVADGKYPSPLYK